MKTKTPCNVTWPFVAKHSADVTGVLSGFDRLRLRGTLRALYQPTVLLRYFFVCQVLLKGFKNYALGVTRRIVEHAEGMATKAGHPWRYLGSAKVSKEEGDVLALKREASPRSRCGAWSGSVGLGLASGRREGGFSMGASSVMKRSCKQSSKPH
ncbi:MAG TPA: hypothetical protein VN829_08320 [Dongiaceae bacterium]|nr:hypothetical protein [Dongiaceae bacterium]